MPKEMLLQDHVNAFVSGQKQAFVALWGEVNSLVYRIMAGSAAGTKALSGSQAEDLTLDVMEKVYLKLPKAGLRDTALFMPWLYRVAVNHKRDVLLRRKELPFSDVPAAADSATSDSCPADELEQREVSDVVATIVSDLDMEEQMILQLRVQDHMRFQDLARLLEGEPPKTDKYKRKFYRICARVRKSLEAKYGIDGFREL